MVARRKRDRAEVSTGIKVGLDMFVLSPTLLQYGMVHR